MNCILRKKIFLVTNGNYFASIISKRLIQEGWIVGCVLVDGDYKGETGVISVYKNFKKNTFIYLCYKIFINLMFLVVSKLGKHVIVEDDLKQSGIPYIKVSKISNDKVKNFIDAHEHDIFLSISCPQLIKEEIYGYAKIGAMNIHSSLLPVYAGINPYYWVLVCGERYTGVTVHMLTSKFDSGDIVLQKRIGINCNESVFGLFERLAYVGQKLIVDSCLKLAAREKMEKQNLTNRTYYSHPDLKSYITLRRNGHKLIKVKDIYDFVFKK